MQKLVNAYKVAPTEENAHKIRKHMIKSPMSAVALNVEDCAILAAIC